MTDLDPYQHSKEEIATLLFNSGGQKNLTRGKLDEYFAFDIEEYLVTCFGPNLFLLPNRDLKLSDFQPVETGNIDAVFGTTLGVAAVAAVAVAAFTAGDLALGAWKSWRSSSQRSKQKFLDDVEAQLVALVQAHAGDPGDYVVKRSESSVAAHCTRCSRSSCHGPFSIQYSSGFFSSPFQRKEALRQLLEHNQKVHPSVPWQLLVVI